MNNENISSKSNINWFPGHMARARNEIKESLKLVDLTAEIVDARIPASSRNPNLDEICGLKPRVVVLNKTDLIDKESINKWIDFYKKRGIPCVPFSMKNSGSKKIFTAAIKSIMKEKIDAWKEKGLIGRKVRVMIVGIPNVGKSSFINSFAKSSKAKVENRPGVTRKNQWITAGEDLQFLDTPGVLQPKIEGKDAGYNLAITGAIKDSILDIEELAVFLIEEIKEKYAANLAQRFKLSEEMLEGLSAGEILELIGKKRGMLISGGEIDTLRASEMLLEEFRSGKLGKIILEVPENLED